MAAFHTESALISMAEKTVDARRSPPSCDSPAVPRRCAAAFAAVPSSNASASATLKFELAILYDRAAIGRDCGVGKERRKAEGRVVVAPRPNILAEVWSDSAGSNPRPERRTLGTKAWIDAE